MPFFPLLFKTNTLIKLPSQHNSKPQRKSSRAHMCRHGHSVCMCAVRSATALVVHVIVLVVVIAVVTLESVMAIVITIIVITIIVVIMEV